LVRLRKLIWGSASEVQLRMGLTPRVPVALLLDELAAGSAFETIAKEYSVTQADIRAAIRFAAALVATEDRMVALR
jgi:uncharacterized protein (DUF433 family)